MPKWTSSQNNAITDRGRSLVVSAGAGSGKTSVLTERILKKLLDGGDIDSFLIVTFTNAAAADLKEKLYEGINRALSENPASRHLYRQLFAIESANISTIHSFCLDLVKQNFQSLGLSPKLRIADEAEAELMLDKCAEAVFDKGYEDGDRGFLMLVKQLTNQKSDGELKNSLISIYNKLMSYPHPFSWLDERGDALALEKEKVLAEVFSTEFGKILVEKTKKLISEGSAILEEAEEFSALVEDKLFEPFKALAEAYDRILEVVDSGYLAVKDELSKVKIPSLPKKKYPPEIADYASDLKTNANNKIKEIADFYSDSPQEIFADTSVALRIHEEFSKLLQALDGEYVELKSERGVLDFSDLEHLALKLLTDGGQSLADIGQSELCKRLSGQFEEIYIDEYQDTNPVQDAIFSLIAKPDNKFIVGDVKQSLYRFRNAEPELFNSCIDKAGDFENGGKSARIFLKENFRCDKPIIDFTNRIFEECYDGIYGDYGDNEKLIFGKEDKENPELVLVAEIAEDEEVWNSYGEADFVADMILKYKKELRKADGEELRFSDFAILLRAPKTGAEPFLRALQNRGIPSYTEQSGSFLETPEILLAVSLLKAVDNPRNDVALTSLLRSPIFSFTDDELAELRFASRDGTMYDSLRDGVRRYRARVRDNKYRAYPEISSSKNQKPKTMMRMPRIKETTAKKVDEFLKRLELWQRKSEGVPSYKFIWFIYGSTGLYSLVSNEKNGEVMQRNLLLLYEHARMFENTSFRGLNSFISYLGEIYDNKKPLSEAPAVSQNNDCVRIMSIHKSKGLQFEVCFLSNTEKSIKSANRSSYIMRRDAGFFFKKRFVRGLYVRKSFPAKLWAEKEAHDDAAESMRALYVALTRAKIKLFVTGGVPKKKKSADSFMEQIKKAVFADGQKTPYAEFIRVGGDESSLVIEEAPALIEEEQFGNSDELIRRIEYRYPYAAVSLSQLAVSHLKLGSEGFAISEDKTPKLARPVFDSKGVDFADTGTAMHMFMQFANLGFAAKSTKDEAERLVKAELITKIQSELLDYRKLEHFFESKLYDRIKSSPNVIREKRFSITEESEFFGLPAGEKVQVQGVIDMFFEEEGEIVVVDFKTDRISEKTADGFVERHTPQLSYYCRALERMTGRKIKEALLYSFALGREFSIDFRL